MYCVIDIGGTYTKYGYFTKEGNCLEKNKFSTIKTNREEFYQKIVTLISDDVEGLAISMPGIIDSHSGMIHAITLLPFLAHHNIIHDLHEYINIPISIENDAKCATLGEMWKGSLKDVCNGMMIVIGSGIGGTLVMNHQIVSSPRYKAGEIGSLLMPLDNTYQNMTNFGRNNNANTLIQTLNQFLSASFDGETVFKHIKDNEQANKTFKLYCRQIAFMIYNFDYLLDLDVVSIGGGISEQPLLLQTIQHEYLQLRKQYEEDQHFPQIVSSMYNNDANLLGALYHYLKDNV